MIWKISWRTHLLLLAGDSSRRNVRAGNDAVANTLSGGLASAREGELGVDTLNAVSRVDVLDEGELPACGGTLARNDGRGSKEVLPDL